MAGRTDLNVRNDNPGPGTYSNLDSFGKGGKGCALAGRTRMDENID